MALLTTKLHEVALVTGPHLRSAPSDVIFSSGSDSYLLDSATGILHGVRYAECLTGMFSVTPEMGIVMSMYA